MFSLNQKKKKKISSVHITEIYTYQNSKCKYYIPIQIFIYYCRYFLSRIFWTRVIYIYIYIYMAMTLLDITLLYKFHKSLFKFF